MKFWLVVFCLWTALGCSSRRAEPGLAENLPVLDGALLFKAKGCVTCHTIGGGILVGPDLQGLLLRRDEAWVRRYISDPVTMTAQDPIARQLKAQFKVQMPRMALSSGELDSLIVYLRNTP